MVHDICILYVPQVTVSGTTVMFSGSMGNVTGLALMNGETYSVSVVARNSIGNSEMFIVMLFVPCDCSSPANVALHTHTHLTSTHNETPSWPLSPAVPPNITMQPVAVTPNENTTQCCSGIQMFLEDPTDPTIVFTAQVSTDSTPFTDRSVTREGDVVYVEGLQAGTPYNIRLTGRNGFRSVMKEVSTIPQIGERQYILCCMTFYLMN